MQIACGPVRGLAKTALAVAVTLAAPDRTVAQPLETQVITISAEQKSIERGGKLQSCALNFGQLYTLLSIGFGALRSQEERSHEYQHHRPHVSRRSQGSCAP